MLLRVCHTILGSRIDRRVGSRLREEDISRVVLRDCIQLTLLRPYDFSSGHQTSTNTMTFKVIISKFVQGFGLSIRERNDGFPQILNRIEILQNNYEKRKRSCI